MYRAVIVVGACAVAASGRSWRRNERWQRFERRSAGLWLDPLDLDLSVAHAKTKTASTPTRR